MQARKPACLINITQLNDVCPQEKNFLLFNLLFQSPADVEFEAGETYIFNEQEIKLSHTLKPTDEKWFTPLPSFLVINANGEIVGNLHLLTIGSIYFQERILLMRVNVKEVASLLKSIQDKIRSYKYKKGPNFKNPMVVGLNFLLEKVEAVDASDKVLLEKYTAFTNFYLNRLSDAFQWSQLNVFPKKSYDSFPGETLNSFFIFTKSLRVYFSNENYFFQGRIITFQSKMIKRERKNNKGECFDVLRKYPQGSGGSASVYRIKSMCAPDKSKMARKHPYVYKISRKNSLEADYLASQELDHLKKSHNYQPGFFAMPYLGKNLADYYDSYISVLPNEQFVLEMLKVTHRAYAALATQMKGKFHGDIKAENLCINKNGNIYIIDYNKGAELTRLYAAPEILANEMRKFISFVLAGNKMVLDNFKIVTDKFIVDGEGNIHVYEDDETKAIVAVYAMKDLLDSKSSALEEVFPALAKAKIKIVYDDRDPSVEEYERQGDTWVLSDQEDLMFSFDYSLLTLLNAKSASLAESDVYSLARAMVEFWGDDHKIWTCADNLMLLYQYSVWSEPDELLASLFCKMRFEYSEAIFPEAILSAYQDTLQKCHTRVISERITAKQAADAFEAVYQDYVSYLENRLINRPAN